MRWTDLPRDREFAGGRDDAPVLQRGEWEDLKQRLERLPAGHPSSLDYEDRADEDRADEDRAADARADEEPADVGGDKSGGRGRQTGPDRRASPGRHEAGSARGPERREPYRPWFASGESPEPWFSGDPGA
jgi:hypothetical protein